jgi:integrase
MENTQLELAPSTTVNVTVMPRHCRRSREYLTEAEIEKLIKAAGENRQGHRDATAILIAYRHGLRASELVALRWDDIDFRTGKLHVRRAKGGTASVHPLGARGRYAPCAACSGKCRRVFVASMSSCPSAWRL